jgi:hypothetical protein
MAGAVILCSELSSAFFARTHTVALHGGASQPRHRPRQGLPRSSMLASLALAWQ